MNAFILGRLLKPSRYCLDFYSPSLFLALIFMLIGMEAFSQSTVTTLANTYNKAGKGPASALTKGVPTTSAKFNFPAGIALDPSGTYMFLADYNNNAIRYVYALGNKSSSITFNIYNNKSGINHPIGVAVDSNTNVYVLNYGKKGTDGSLMVFRGSSLINNFYIPSITTNVTKLINAAGITLDNFNNAYITVQSNTVIRVTPQGVSTVVGVISLPHTSLTGIAYLANGNLAISDAGNNGIWIMNSTNGNATQLTGFHGAGDIGGESTSAAFNHPEGIAQAGNGLLVVADYNNNQVKVVSTNGYVSRLFGVNSYYWKNAKNLATKGWNDGTVNPTLFLDTVQSRQPYGLAIDNKGNVYDTETYYDLLRVATTTGLPAPPPFPPQPPTITSVTTNFGQISLTWTTSTGATNYNVKRSLVSGGPYTTISSTINTSFTDTNVSVGTVYYYVVSASNAGGEGLNSAEVSATPLPLPPPTILTVVTNLGQVVLTWSSVTAATNYNVKRSDISGGSYATIIGTTNTTYTDTNVIDGHTYYYVVSALNGGGESLNSTEVGATPLFPPAPVFVTVTTNFVQIGLTWSTVQGAIAYNLKRSTSTNGPFTTIVSTSSTSYSDTNVINGTTYFYVVSAVNPGGEGPDSIEISVTQPSAPVPSPQIGYVTFPPPFFTSAFHAGSASGTTFNNDTPIVIIGASGSQTFYTYTNTATVANVPDPSASSASAPVGYQDGLFSLSGLTIAQPLPNLAIKAIGEQTNHANSAIVSAVFQFVVANPQISGTNIYNFTISEITTNAQLYYTVDGSDPTASSLNLSGIATLTNNIWTVSYNASIMTNALFKVVAIRNNYQPSAVVSNLFLKSSSPANNMTFGFASGPGSCQFVASPGQSFVIPVAVSLLASAPPIYGLQFNITVTNVVGSNAVPPAAVEFDPLIGEPDLQNDGYFFPIPTYVFVGNSQPINDPNAIPFPDGNWYQSLQFNNTNNFNLLGVGWLEVFGRTNLYNTFKQNLLTYPILEGTEPYPATMLGAYTFGLPTNANPGDIYQVQIGRPSATTYPNIGYGVPVFIDAPADTNLVGPGSINALKNVTIGYIKYLAGSIYPANWFNAGDFGSFTLINVDVIRVFDFAAYPIASPPFKSDLYDALDSCGYIGVLNSNTGYYTNSFIPAPTSNLFDGNDTNINNIAFGDGVLDVCDVYVTFRRSLDSSLTWYERFWTNGVRVADTAIPNHAAHLATKSPSVKIVQPLVQSRDVSSPQVIFTAGNVQGSAGQTVEVPITATISGSYPLRMLMLNLSVESLTNAPLLTTPIQFNQVATDLGNPYTTESTGNGNYSAVWLNDSSATGTGVTGNVTLGTLSVKVPTNAPINSTFAINFDHASGSPNGLTSFPKQTVGGTITVK